MYKVLTTNNKYYPFGSVTPGRQFSSASYRYGFNGMEKDNEMKGDNNSYEFRVRIYDPRLGRFLSVDPLSGRFPFNSTYAYAENRVLDGIDFEGGEWKSQKKWSDLVSDKDRTATINSALSA